MKKILTSFIIITAFIPSFSQLPSDSAGMAAALKKQAADMVNALISKDYSKFTDYMLPKTIKDAGGKENVVELIKETMEDQASKGIYFIKAEIGEPTSFIKVAKELQCTLSETLTLDVTGGTLVSISTLIAVSSDGGKNWKFLDTANSSLDNLRKSYPNLSSKLKIVDYGKPVFTKD